MFFIDDGWSLVVIDVLGLLGGGSGWFCAGYECFLGGYCNVLFTIGAALIDLESQKIWL